MIRKFLAAALMVAAGTAQASASKWTITDLGLGPNPTFGGWYVTNVNNRGDVTGWGYAGATVPQHHAVIWSEGTLTDLGVPAGSFASDSNAINNKGTVVGNSGNGFLAFYMDGGWTEAGLHGQILDVNDKDVMAGVYLAGNRTHAFMNRDGAFTDLGTFPGGFFSIAYAVNSKNVVTGYSSNTSYTHAFIYENGEMRDAGSLGGSSYAYDINDKGVAVGTSFDSFGREYAVTYDDAGVHPLPVPFNSNAIARSINNHGDIVGTIDSHAFLYSDGAVTMLEQIPAVAAAGWRNLDAVAISDRGWIVGHGLLNGQGRSYVLMPK
jgi:probable HAF family extracellular repeat protein